MRSRLARPAVSATIVVTDPQIAREVGVGVGAERLPECLSSTRWTRLRRHDDAYKLGRQDGRSGRVRRNGPLSTAYDVNVRAASRVAPATYGLR